MTDENPIPDTLPMEETEQIPTPTANRDWESRAKSAIEFG